MRPRTPLWMLAPLVALLSCSYGPDFANDQLQCSAAGQCPKGYSCASDNKCWKNGQTPHDAAATTDGAVTLGDFVGTWTFNAGASGGTLTGTCSDSATPISLSLSGDFMVVTLAGAGLSAQYYCGAGWMLRLSAGTAAATPAGCCACRPAPPPPPRRRGRCAPIGRPSGASRPATIFRRWRSR